MCGIAALINANGGVEPAAIRAMCDLVRHRGPDGEGYALFADDRAWRIDGPDTPAASRSAQSDAMPSRAQVAFGHRRLAIIEPTPAGHQPMSDQQQRYWLTFNGEIYNFVELRAELESLGSIFSTRTDTEVIIAAYDRWGTSCLSRFNGMFAFVLYDRKTRRLFAARDRYGVKPLYVWHAPDGTLALASEIKQFTALSGWRARLDGQRAYDYLNWGLTDHTDRTLFAGVRQFRPGTFVEVALDRIGNDFAPMRWYRIGEAAPALTPDDAVAHWRKLFFDAVRMRLRADVPVGTALSGGLDSSSIVCAVHHLRQDMGISAEQNSFSARSHDPAYDEGAYVAAVVRATGVREHMVWPDADDLFGSLSAQTWHMDEPYGSTSVFAEWCVFRTVAQTPVKVTLDGHGADELLAGYTAFAGPYLAQHLRRGRWHRLLPESRALLASGRHRSVELGASILDDIAPGPLRMALRRLGGRTSSSPDWIDLARMGARPADPFVAEGLVGRGIGGLSLSQIQATSLPMQLHWNDRNSMAHSIESRAPFLDVNLVEFTLALPDALKLAGGTTKVVLRQALADLVPPEVLGRRDKVGFVTPEEVWVRSERPAQFLSLGRTAIERAGGLLTAAASQRIEDIVSGRQRFHNSLWRIISFGVWLDRFDVAAD